MDIKGLEAYFTREKIIRNGIVAFAFLSAGIIVLILFYLLANIPARGGNLQYFFQNAGYFLLFLAITMIYASIHRGNASGTGHSARSLAVYSIKKGHLLGAVLLGSVLVIFVAALTQALVSFIGYIPYAGPAAVSLLTLPMFAINFAVILLAVLAWVLLPPMVGEGIEPQRAPAEFIALVKTKGLVVIGYTFGSLVASLVLFAPLLMIIRYAAGITRAAQWNIAAGYPPVFKSILRPSYITDILSRIMPHTDPIAAFQQYGSSLFNYVELLGAVLKISYGIALVALIAFFMSLLFNFLSYCYGRITHAG